jgi:hypothetical protein
MMKGLFAYESAYRNYTRACIKDFVDDNIQYAEVRPNFMQTNQLKTDCGSEMLENGKIMEILDEVVKKTLAEIKEEGRYFADMKVIYCTPRSFGNELTEKSLNECIELKKKFSHLICGKLSNQLRPGVRRLMTLKVLILLGTRRWVMNSANLSHNSWTFARSATSRILIFHFSSTAARRFKSATKQTAISLTLFC